MEIIKTEINAHNWPQCTIWMPIIVYHYFNENWNAISPPHGFENFVRLTLNFLSTGQELRKYLFPVSYAVLTFINETSTDPVKDSMLKNIMILNFS